MKAQKLYLLLVALLAIFTIALFNSLANEKSVSKKYSEKPALAKTLNGFELSNAKIPIEEILRGGPPKDGIPALSNPEVIHANSADYLNLSDRILGVEINGQARAYPIRILNHHEIVNDVVGQQAISITYCPLCGSGMAFDAIAGDKTRDFGVSGLLYNSDVLMYDQQTESLWSQISARAVAGLDSGTELNSIPVRHTSWVNWKQSHPNTTVLSLNTGHMRNYELDPYSAYKKDKRTLMFPVAITDQRLEAKVTVIGLSLDGQTRAWPFTELEKTNGIVSETVGDTEIAIHFDAEHQTAYVTNNEKEIPSLTSYWFAWYAFHPETTVYLFTEEN